MNGTSDTTMALEPPNHYNYDLKLNWLTRALYFSAGADVQLLKYCPNYDRVKMQGIGGTVIATAILAFFAGSYAFYTIFAPKQEAISWLWFFICIFVGMAWATMIYNLDRFIVSASGHGDGTDKITWGEFGKALPRLLMAALIGIVIAKPLEIRIMKTEIDVKIVEAQNAVMDREVKRAAIQRDEDLSKIERAKIEIVAQKDVKVSALDQLSKARDEADNRYQKELLGLDGRQRGIGPIARENKITAERRLQEYLEGKEIIDSEVNQLNKQIEQKNTEIERVYKDYEESRIKAKEMGKEFDGLINRIAIAHEIAPMASYFLTLLLVFLEIAPLLFKMMLNLSPIDFLTENQKRLSLIQRGINVSHGLAAERGAIEDVKVAIYSEVELDYARRIGKMQVDQELTELQHQKFKEEIAKDIDQNPSQYIERVKPLE